MTGRFVDPDPFHGLSFPAEWLTCPAIDDERFEFKAFRVEAHLGERPGGLYDDSELLVCFANECVSRRLPRFGLSSGEFP